MGRALLVGALMCLSHGALASAPSKIRAVDRQPLGLTLTLTLDAAPFPDGRSRYTDSSVVVFIPAAYRPARNGRVDFVLHYHGHHATAAEALRSTQLDQQLAASGRNALLVVPQLALQARDSSAGRLERSGGVRRLLHEVIATLSHPEAAARLGHARLPARPKLGQVVVSAHSGGFQGAAFAVSRGGVSVREVYLFDALYGYAGRFADWLKGDPRRRLLTWCGGGAKIVKWTRILEKALDGRRIPRLADAPEGTLAPADYRGARAVLIDTAVPHHQVPFGRNALRDALITSPLIPCDPNGGLAPRD